MSPPPCSRRSSPTRQCPAHMHHRYLVAWKHPRPACADLSFFFYRWRHPALTRVRTMERAMQGRRARDDASQPGAARPSPPKRTKGSLDSLTKFNMPSGTAVVPPTAQKENLARTQLHARHGGCGTARRDMAVHGKALRTARTGSAWRLHGAARHPTALNGAAKRLTPTDAHHRRTWPRLPHPSLLALLRQLVLLRSKQLTSPSSSATMTTTSPSRTARKEARRACPFGVKPAEPLPSIPQTLGRL